MAIGKVILPSEKKWMILSMSFSEIVYLIKTLWSGVYNYVFHFIQLFQSHINGAIDTQARIEIKINEDGIGDIIKVLALLRKKKVQYAKEYHEYFKKANKTLHSNKK